MPTEIAAASATTVTTALKAASAKTGAGFDFLMEMAKRESSLNPQAQAKTSSAAGLFQFIEQTWLSSVKEFGARHGLGSYAADIARGPDGRFAVADAARRDEILNLRFDAKASAVLAGELANRNRAVLEQNLGRAANSADLYTAHFLGASGAVKMLTAPTSAKAADLLPQAASANRAVFYDGARARTVGEVTASIAASMTGATAAPSSTPLYSSSGRASFVPQPFAALTALPAPASRLTALALSALQALDATGVGESREDKDRG